MDTSPHIVPDTEELKAKYAEVAALKKAIDEKKRATSSKRVAHHQAFRVFPNRGNIRGRRGLFRGRNFRNSTPSHRNMTLVFSNGDEDKDNLEQKQEGHSYISAVSKSGMTLVKRNLYERDQGKFVSQIEQLKAEEERFKRQLRLNNRISRNRKKTDSCDRISIDGDKFAVSKQADKLIPITKPIHEELKTLVWNNKSYERKDNGTYKCQSRRQMRYVTSSLNCFLSTNISSTVAEQCRYLTRTGKFSFMHFFNYILS